MGKMRFKYGWTGAFRWLFRRPCREPFCNDRRHCWRWHIEVVTCPTCGRDVDENDTAAFVRVTDHLLCTPSLLVQQVPANTNVAMSYVWPEGPTGPMVTDERP